MNRQLHKLLVAQFLSAFADNAILFTAFAMIMKSGTYGEWYKPALQASFLFAFVVLAPWVGRVADEHTKGRVLTWGNAVKLGGTVLLLIGIEPLLAYGVVGIGAALYGPAKYGILPELAGHEQLVKANGLVEGSTIVAIVLGAVVGARVADQGITMALAMVGVAYLVSLLITVTLPATVTKQRNSGAPIRQFAVMMRSFFITPRARFAMLGASIFWAAAVVLRVMLVAWAPAVLLTHATTDIANLTVFIAIGIALGAVLVPRLVPIEQLRRARHAAYLMGFAIMLLAFTHDQTLAKVVLLLIGISGGIFVVPINAALQEIGQRTIGAGGAVAIQNFFENLAMLVGTGLYTLALTQRLDPLVAMVSLGIVVVLATVLIAWHLPKQDNALMVGSSTSGN